MAYVSLNRTFRPVSIDEQDEERIQTSIWMGLRNYDGSWDALLKNRYVVVLGEAGIGKTEEFQQKANSLSRQGQYGFFVQVENIADSPERWLSPDQIAKFRQWKDSGEDAIFFLDSIDDARLRNWNALERSMLNLHRSLEDHWHRVRWVFSCRVSDWQYISDKVTLAPYLQFTNSQQSENSQEVTSLDLSDFLDAPKPMSILHESEEQETSQSHILEIYQIEPLNTEQVKILAEHFGVNEAEKFMEAMRNSDLFKFAGRPRDLNALVDYWNENARFGTLAEMMEANITQKSKEDKRYRAEQDRLSLADARSGAERAAAGLSFCGFPAIRVPESALEAENLPPALDPGAIFPEWEQRQVGALLGRPIFDEATYGRVRFHDRSVSEYLVAQWLINRLKDHVSPKKIAGVLFQKVFGETLVNPAMKGVVGWVAARDRKARKILLQAAPELLLLSGDPAQLSVSVRISALKRIAKKYHNRRYIGWFPSHHEMRRIAHPHLSKIINKLINKYRFAEDVRIFLFDIVQTGKISGCKKAALQVALDENEKEDVRIAALDAIAEVGSSDQMIELATYLKQGPIQSNSLIAAFIRTLFPQFLVVEELFSLVKQTEREAANISTLFSRVMREDVVNDCHIEQLPSLLQSLLALAITPPLQPSGEDGLLSIKFWWTPAVLERVFIRILKETARGQLPLEILKECYFLLEHCKRLGAGDHDSFDELTKELKNHAELRQTLFWGRVISDRDGGGGWLYMDSTYTLCPLTEEDVPWLLDDLQNRQNDNDREIALDTLLHLWSFLSKHEQIRIDIETAIKEIPEFIEKAKPWSDPAPYVESEQERKWAIKKKERERAEKERHDANQKLLTENLEEIREANNPDLLSFLYREMNRESGDGRSRWAGSNWMSLEEKYGKNVAEAARDGWKKFWRTWQPLLPITRTDNTGGWEIAIGLTGIQIEVEQGLDFSLLSSEEAEVAACYALHEMNGFPQWLSNLASAHAETVRRVCQQQFQGEFDVTGDNSPSVRLLSNVRYGSDEIIDFFAPQIFFLLEEKEPASLHYLNDSADVLCKQTVIDWNDVARLAERRTKEHAESRNLPSLLAWFRTWQHAEAEGAWNYIEQLVGSSPEYSGDFAIQLGAALGGSYRARLDGLRLSTILPKTLRRMIPFFFAHIPQSTDIRHEGVYTPGARDRAQDYRNSLLNILAAIPGQAARDALKSLSKDYQMEQERDWILRLIDQHAERETWATEWSPQRVVEFEKAGKPWLWAFLEKNKIILGLIVTVLGLIWWIIKYFKLFSAPTVSP